MEIILKNLVVTILLLVYSQSSLSKILSERSMIQTLDFVHQMGSDIYCYWDIKKKMYGVDWDVIIKEAKQKVTFRTSRSEFNEILDEVAASVKDGHVRYLGLKPGTTLYKTGATFVSINGVIYSAKKIRSENNGLEVGDKIIKVDGLNIENVLIENKKKSFGSTPLMIHTASVMKLGSHLYYKSPPKKKRVYSVERDGKKIEIELPWETIVIPDNGEDSVNRGDLVTSRILPGNIGYLRVRAMKSSLIKLILKKMDSLAGTNGLIIDVRYNGGGNGSVGDAIISRLVTKKVLRYKASAKLSRQVTFGRPGLLEKFQKSNVFQNNFSSLINFEIIPTFPFYDKSVIVLTNERCFSACDTFVDSFSSNKIGKILGTQTGGGTGYPIKVKLPYDLGYIQFSVLQGWSNYGRLIEGIGTIPDITLEESLVDLVNNRDGVLSRALTYVQNALGQKKTDQINFKPHYDTNSGSMLEEMRVGEAWEK